MAGVLAGLFGSGSGGAGLGALAGGGGGGGGGGFLEGLLPHDKLSGGWLSGTGSYRGGQDPNKIGIDMGSILANNSMMSAPTGVVAPPGGVGPVDSFAGIGPSSADGIGSMVDAQVAASDQAAVSRGMTPMQAPPQAPPMQAPPQAGAIDPFKMSRSDSIVADGGGFMGTLGLIGEGIGTAFDGIDQGIGALNDSALVSGFRGAMDTIGNSPLGDMSRGFSNGMAAYRGEDPMFPGEDPMLPGGDPMADPWGGITDEAWRAALRKKRDQAAAQGGL
jgi:hypothetical protein